MAKVVNKTVRTEADEVFGKRRRRSKIGRPPNHSLKDPNMLSRYRYEQIPLSAYFTPEWCVHALLDYKQFDGLVWEPFVGRGNIARVLEQNDLDVVCSDIKDYGYNYTWQLDFNRENIEVFAKEICKGKGFRWIITNPPYLKCVKYVERVLWLCKEFNAGAAMLLRNEFDCGKTRGHIFQDNPAYWGKIVLTTRPLWFSDIKAAPRHNYSWYIWDEQNPVGENKNLRYSYRRPDGESEGNENGQPEED